MNDAKKIRMLAIGAVLTILGISIGYAAYTALSVTTNIAVKEPISLTSFAASGDLNNPDFSCTIDPNTEIPNIRATCTGSLFAGESGSVDITVSNAANVGITVQAFATSSSSDITITSPSTTVVPAHGGMVFSVLVSVSQSFPTLPTPPPVTLTIDFSR